MSAPLDILAAVLGAERAGAALEALGFGRLGSGASHSDSGYAGRSVGFRSAENAGGTWEDMIEAAQLSSGNSGSASG